MAALKYFGLVLATFAGGFAANALLMPSANVQAEGGNDKTFDVVKARSFVLVDKEGAKKGEFAYDAKNERSGLELYEKEGTPQLELMGGKSGAGIMIICDPQHSILRSAADALGALSN